MEVKSTSAYDVFSYLKGNRPVRKGHLSHLIKSISKKNLLHLAPILVNKRMEIIDGQHRLEAAKFLKTPIYYLVDNEASAEEAKVLNATLSKWTLRNFVDSYVEKGNKDYQELKEFSESYSISPLVAGAMLNTDFLNTTALRGIEISALKEGRYKIKNYDLAEELVEEIKQLSEYCQSDFYYNREFVLAYFTARKQIEPKKLLEAFKKTGIKIRLMASWRQYLEVFESTYFKAFDKSIHLY